MGPPPLPPFEIPGYVSISYCYELHIKSRNTQAAQRGGQLGQYALGLQLERGPPNYIASLLCSESVDGSQEAVGRGPPDNFRTNMVFLYITDEDQIR